MDRNIISILIIDDNPICLKLLTNILNNYYKVYSSASVECALEFLDKIIPDLILVDIDMLYISDFEAINKIKSDIRLVDIPIIFISGIDTTEKEEKAFSVGAVDYINKTISPSILLARINTRLSLSGYNNSLEDMVITKIIQLEKAQNAILDILAEITNFRDNETGDHLIRTTEYTRKLIEKLIELNHPNYSISEEYATNIIKTAKLHDIGKVAIPDSILLKPGKLTAEEFNLIKNHTTFGAQIIEQAISKLGEDSSFLHIALEIVASHHEWWDGSGYPYNLLKDEIPLSARIIAITDVYDALISKRPYKDGMPHEKALHIIYEGSGTHFDPQLLELSKEVIDDFKKIKVNEQ